MAIAANSVVIQFIVYLWRGLLGLWSQSAVGRWFRRAERAVRTCAGDSAVCRFVARDGVILRTWPESILCRVVTAVVNIPCALFKWIYKISRGLWDGSVTFRALSALGGAAWLPLGLVLLVMLCVPHDMWNNTYGFLGVVLVTALFLVGCMNRARQRLQVERLGPYLILYAGFIFYGLAASLSTSLSLRFFLFHVTCFLIVLLMVSSIKRYSQLQLMVALVGAGLLLAALYGCYQGYVGVDVVASQQDLILNAGMPGRIYSFFDNPNNFAEILVMLTPLMLALLINARTFGGKFLALVVLGVSVAAIGFTYSRSGWIGLVLAVVLFFAFQNWRLVPVILVVGIIAIPFLPESIYNRVLTIGNMEDSSTRYRFSIWESTGQLLKDYGWRGVGLGNDIMKKVFQQYPPMSDGNYPIHTHNNYLQMWAEVGFLGLLAYLAAVLGQLKAGVKAFVHSTDRKLKIMLSAAISALCGILLISLAEYTWFYPRNMFLFWFLFGVIAVCVKIARTPEETK
ncbi:MAG: O-antigen ligase family protein [Aristaeellaceae bacterium]